MIEVKELRKTFNEGKVTEVEVLKGINLSFPDKGLYVILGPSGSGKSTLLSILGCLEEASSGSVVFNGKELTHLSRKEIDVLHQKYFSFIFQDHNLVEYLNLLDNAMLKGDDKEKALSIIKRLNIEPLMHKKPSELSGGEKERCAIARALLSETQVVFCDEPTASLDSKNAENVIALLKEVSETKLVIVVSHDEKLCKKYTDNLIYIKDGIIEKNLPIVNDETPDEVLDLSKPTPIYHKGIFKRALNHSLHKYKHTILIGILSLIGYLAASIIIGLANGSNTVVDESMTKVMHSNPVTISSYYEDITSFKLISDIKQDVDGTVHAQSNQSITDSLHVNVISDEFVDYITSFKRESCYFSFNNDCTYPVIYRSNSGYNLYDNDGKESLTDYLEMFLGRRTVFSEIIYEQKYYDDHFEKVAGRFPQNDNEVMVMLDSNYLVHEDVLEILNAKDGTAPEQLIGKEFAFAENDDIYDVNDTRTYTAYYLKDKETLKEENIDIRSLTNSLVGFANAYYDGDVDKQHECADNVRSFFKETQETKTINAYSKIKNSALLEDFYNKTPENQMKVVGVYKTPSKEAFTEKGVGILIPRNKLKTFREKQSHSIIANEMDTHIALTSRGSDIDMPVIYGYKDSAKTTGSSSIEDAIMTYLEFFENRKVYAVNNEYTSIEIYSETPEDKDFYSQKINEFNENKSEPYKIRQLDLSKMLIIYFDKYYGILEKVLYMISIITLVISGVLSVAIIFNLVALRVKEIGILRSSGYSVGYVFALIEVENVILGLISGALAVAGAHLLLPLINNYFATVTVDLAVDGLAKLSTEWSFIIIGLTFVMSFLAALVPSLIYSRKKANDTLRS